MRTRSTEGPSNHDCYWWWWSPMSTFSYCWWGRAFILLLATQGKIDGPSTVLYQNKWARIPNFPNQIVTNTIWCTISSISSSMLRVELPSRQSFILALPLCNRPLLVLRKKQWSYHFLPYTTSEPCLSGINRRLPHAIFVPCDGARSCQLCIYICMHVHR